MAQLFKYKVRQLSSATTEAWVAWIFTVSCVDVMQHKILLWFCVDVRDVREDIYKKEFPMLHMEA